MLRIQKLTFEVHRRVYPLIILKRNKVRKLSRQMYPEYQPVCNNPPRIRKSHFVNVLGLIQRTTLTFAEVLDWMKWKHVQELREDQAFLPDRHNTLGPDLATAHFITIRGGKIRFKGSQEWLTKVAVKSKQIPSNYVPYLAVEGVDASGTELCYEGFDNLIDLFSLKELILKNCEYVDDHVLNRMHVVQHSLEVLDISGCHSITERGLCTLHVLKNLKKLIINDLPRVSHKELTCLLLQDIIPHCEIEGIDYDDPGLHRRLRSYM